MFVHVPCNRLLPMASQHHRKSGSARLHVTVPWGTHVGLLLKIELHAALEQ